MSRLRFPRILDVALALRNVNNTARYDDPDEEGVDVRLQVYDDGSWAVRWGSSDYDQDHRGHWGAASVPGNGRNFRSVDCARHLLDQARNSHADNEASK